MRERKRNDKRERERKKNGQKTKQEKFHSFGEW